MSALFSGFWERTHARQTVTSQIEISADSFAVFAVVADPRRLAEWAATFADRIEQFSDDQWIATKGSRLIELMIVVSESCGTVDYVRKLPTGKRGGAYIRVIDAPQAGCVVVMTVPVSPDSSPQKTSVVLDKELAAAAQLI